MSVEIYICDLKPEVQEQVLSELNLSSDKDGNYDLFPLFVVDFVVLSYKVGKTFRFLLLDTPIRATFSRATTCLFA